MKKRDRVGRNLYIQNNSGPDKVRARTPSIRVSRKYIPYGRMINSSVRYSAVSSLVTRTGCCYRYDGVNW